MKHLTRLSLASLLAGLGTTPSPGDAFIRNPSFESNYNETWPHYGPADEWTGASGVNDASGPFHNNGTAVPDRDRIGFKQGAGEVTQDITGLTPNATYWLQCFYDGRTGGGAAESLAVLINDTEIARVADLKPSTTRAYHFLSAPFIAPADTATLKFKHTVSGDRTLLLDGVTIVARSTNDLVLRNPSFEASGKLPAVGILTSLAGWSQTGTVGVDDGSAGYANSGAAPDQDLVAFIDGAGSISQPLDGLIVGNEYEIRVSVNAKTGTSPNLQVKVGDTVVNERAIAPGAYQTLSLKFKATTTDTTLTIAQTKEGSHTLLVDNARLLGVARKPLPPMTFSPLASEVAPGQAVNLSLTLPPEALADGPVDIKLANSNPRAATLVGAAADGTLTLRFNKPASATEPVTVGFVLQTLGRGQTSINVTEAAKIPVGSTPLLNVVSSLVKNASFESNPAGAFPGYGDILGWQRSGSTGLNRTDNPNNPAGPFGDNGLVPDREQVAFIQGNGSLSQEITGLAQGRTYWLQFHYNARNCCGDRTVSLNVRFAGKTLLEVADLKPRADAGETTYYFASLPFTAETSSGLLEFVGAAKGDGSLVIDAVNIVPRASDEIVIRNPSFEASGSPPGVGYVQPYAIAGWDGGGGGRGINIDGEGPFTDNGDVPDQDRAAFLQNTGSGLSQNITGLTAGQKYTLVVSLNARNCCGGIPVAKVSLGEEVLMEEEVPQIGGRRPYAAKYLPFTAQGTEAVLRIELSGPAGSDVSLLVDDVHLVPGQRTLPAIATQPSGARLNAGETLNLSASATGTGLRYEWRRDGVALVDGPRITGASTPSLKITGATAADAGNYTLAVTDGLGVVASDPAAVEITASESPSLAVRLVGTTLEITSSPQPLPAGFVLQTAPTVTGPWVDQAGATTPLTLPLGNGSARFLRAVRP